MTALTLGTSSSFKYENLATWPMSDLSISASNSPQDLCQAKCVPWNFVITSLGSLTFGLPASLSFSTVFASNFFLISILAFSSFSWVSLASCSLNFCSSSSNSLTTFSSLPYSTSIPKLQSLMTSSPHPILSTCTIAFISWNFSTLLSIGCHVLFESVLTNCFQQSCWCFQSSAAVLSICFGLFSPDFWWFPLSSLFRSSRAATFLELLVHTVNSRSPTIKNSTVLMLLTLSQ